jgi:hypothetical protein
MIHQMENVNTLIVVCPVLPARHRLFPGGFFTCGIPCLVDGVQSLFEVDVAGIEGFANDGTLDAELVEHFKVEE